MIIHFRNFAELPTASSEISGSLSWHAELADSELPWHAEPADGEPRWHSSTQEALLLTVPRTVAEQAVVLTGTFDHDWSDGALGWWAESADIQLSWHFMQEALLLSVWAPLQTWLLR
ncbi:hypothetical protein CBR_g39886 [Chara braunii]|uniref:Uncharacterized protein n=1 Tax=Chara braunii TaxID=69332 RepID=A0A388LST3_CHABU|nr:hypothetical protein CBR_g39886 [Chara braunii]|eukprot:GBG85319.1 hypothetical protein CBR_g39886 [Chara braunii]